MRNDADTVSTLQTFKIVADNFLTRNVLKALSKYCNYDKGNQLEVALELHVGVRENACFRCRFSRRILSPILNVASKAFGITEAQLKEKFMDPYWRRGLISVIKGIAWFGVRRPYVPGAPFQVVWNITRACNLNCIHCYENAGLQGDDELTTAEALRGIDLLAEAGVLILAFSGGEPTIRPDILKLIRKSADQGMFSAVATNALLFASRKKVKEFKNAGLQFAQISLDGLNPQTHDKFRGVHGAFRKTVQGIKNCVAENLFVEVAATATRFNYKEIPDMIEFVEELGVNWFMLYNFVPTGRGVDIIESDLTPEEREDILKVCWNRMKTAGIEVLSTAPQFARVAQEVEAISLTADEAETVNPGEHRGTEGKVVPTHFYNPKLSGQLRALADFIGGCGAGRFYMSLEPNGDMFPCVFFPHKDAVKVGNLFKDDFQSVWRNSKLLWQLRDKDKLGENCGSCDFRYTCGGCRARAYNYLGDVLAPDPGCILNREFWTEIQAELKKDEQTKRRLE
ncbi:MAG: radical SAM protein [Candidatus Bathyarchaeota archaeon]|nr:MAG: radical SAM protein [Candidatus Bathyarchaeota archaeon]